MEAAKAASDADALIRRTLDYLGRTIRVQAAILFGSHARGSADRWSDVDLAVVSPDFARMSSEQIMDLLVEVALAVDPRVEIRPYTPHELKEARPTNFLGHIVATGKLIRGKELVGVTVLDASKRRVGVRSAGRAANGGRRRGHRTG